MTWQGAPDGTRSYALSLVDLHPVARGYVHWLVGDIGPETTSIPEGAATGGLAVGREPVSYKGPFPPSGTHEYEFTLYAVGVPTVPLRSGVSLEAFRREMARSSLGSATLSGSFTKIG